MLVVENGRISSQVVVIVCYSFTQKESKGEQPRADVAVSWSVIKDQPLSVYLPMHMIPIFVVASLSSMAAGAPAFTIPDKKQEEGMGEEEKGCLPSIHFSFLMNFTRSSTRPHFIQLQRRLRNTVSWLSLLPAASLPLKMDQHNVLVEHRGTLESASLVFKPQFSSLPVGIFNLNQLIIAWSW